MQKYLYSPVVFFLKLTTLDSIPFIFSCPIVSLIDVIENQRKNKSVRLANGILLYRSMIIESGIPGWPLTQFLDPEVSTIETLYGSQTDSENSKIEFLKFLEIDRPSEPINGS